jgi:alkyl hydroperoxide reductase subunit AhpF
MARYLFSGMSSRLLRRSELRQSIDRNKPLAVIGGGDSAAEEATCTFFTIHIDLSRYSSRIGPDLTKYGSHVYVLVRRSELRASKIMAKRLQNNPKIVIICLQLLKLSDQVFLDHPVEYCSH